MKAEEILNLSNEELERMIVKGDIPLSAYSYYIGLLKSETTKNNISLEEAVELAFNLNNEHSVYFAKAYQRLKR